MRVKTAISERDWRTAVKTSPLGWSDESLRRKKYERYMAIDGDGIYGSLDQYESIFDENPNLVEFIE